MTAYLTPGGQKGSGPTGMCLGRDLKTEKIAKQSLWAGVVQEKAASTKALGHWGLDLCEAKSVLFLVTSPATGMAAGI